jgi:PAS domain-containing protein
MLDVDPRESQPERIEHIKSQSRQEREELQRIVDLIPQSIIVLNPDGKDIYANRVAIEYTGLSLDEADKRISTSTTAVTFGRSNHPRWTIYNGTPARAKAGFCRPQAILVRVLDRGLRS